MFWRAVPVAGVQLGSLFVPAAVGVTAVVGLVGPWGYCPLFWLGLFAAGVVDGIAVLGLWKRAILVLNLVRMMLIPGYWAG